MNEFKSINSSGYGEMWLISYNDKLFIRHIDIKRVFDKLNMIKLYDKILYHINRENLSLSITPNEHPEINYPDSLNRIRYKLIPVDDLCTFVNSFDSKQSFIINNIINDIKSNLTNSQTETNNSDKVTVFENEEFGRVRIVMIDDEPYFVGKDVAEILGYTNPSKALADHVDEEDKLNNESLSSLGQRGGWIINESGLYSLILSSKLPNAKKFKRWVTSEVLPSIRKNGAYMNGETIERILTSPDFLIELATKLKAEKEARVKAEAKVVMLDRENEMLAKDNLSWADRSVINALVRKYAAACCGSYANAWIQFKSDLLYKYSINLNSRKTNYIKRYNKKPKTLDLLKDEELVPALNTIVSMNREMRVDIDDILNNIYNEEVGNKLKKRIV